MVLMTSLRGANRGIIEMAYATISDIFSRYRPINTLVGSGVNDVTSVDVSSVFIYDAENFVNAFLAKRYAIPVGDEPLVTMITCDLAISNMMLEKLGEIPGFMQPRYDRSLKLLESLRDGDMILVGSGTTISTSGDQEAWSTTQSYHPIFSPVLDGKDQTVDQNWIDADKDTRAGDVGVGS